MGLTDKQLKIDAENLEQQMEDDPLFNPKERRDVCINCKFLEKKYQQCRRYPPTPVYSSGLGAIREWHPAMDEDDWCGEWTKSEG